MRDVTAMRVWYHTAYKRVGTNEDLSVHALRADFFVGRAGFPATNIDLRCSKTNNLPRWNMFYMQYACTHPTPTLTTSLPLG